MELALVALQWVNAAAFSAVGLITIRSWWHRRDPQHAALALAVGGLGLVSALGRVAPTLDYPRWLATISLVAFLVSGWGLLRFRHSVMPLSPRINRAALSIIIVTGLATLAARLPTKPGQDIGPIQLGMLFTVILVWSACVGEPALRFFRAAKGRALVVRRRLRALSLGYVGIVLILLTAMTTRPDAEATAAQLAFGLAALTLAPLMYVSLAPPRWLRKRWRAREEGALREALQDIVRSPDARSAARDGLAWSMRILGAEAGFVIDASGTLLAADGLTPEQASSIAAGIRHPGIVALPGGERHLAVCPLYERDAAGLLAVASGPFSPVFGRDEVETLRDLSTTIAGAIERHALNQALRAESARYSSLLNAISDVGFAVTMVRDNKVVSVNEAMTEISGFERMELLTLESMFDLIPDSHRAESKERFTRFLEGVGDDHWEGPIARKDGVVRELEGASKLLDLDGVPHVLTIARDVTERKAATERDRRRASQLDALAKSSSALAGIRELQDLGPAIAAAAAAVSRGADAVIGMPSAPGDMTWFDASSAIEDPGPLAALAHMTIGQQRTLKRRFVGGVVGAPGQTHEGMGVPVLRRGQLLGVILLRAEMPFDDIDEAVVTSLASHVAEVIEGARALERERAMTRRLRELDDIKNSFLAAVSHELRTPLTSVLGFAHTLRRSGTMIPEAERAMMTERLAVNAEKLGTLLTDLLDLDRLNRGIVEPALRDTDLCALILRAIESFDFPDGRAVHVDVAPINVFVDGPKIERVVENLISNAVRHTRADSPIWVRVTREDGGVTIAVEDAGRGVPVTMRDLIFEPFAQGTKQAHAPGVGIGLSLVRRFAELHGGRAWVTDRPGGGASFRVWLPQDSATQCEPAPATSARA